jgi:alpha-1,2-rhamnosyltransferase
VVGTLEPRKGHEIVLSAFEKLWEEGCRYNLVFTGRIGWKVDRLLERINNSKYLNKRFFVLNDVADELLIALYKNAYACICATMREGFGLPLVESIHFDKPVIASDIEVDKEVGNGYPVYFKSGDPDDLAQSISYLIKSCSNNEKSNFKPITWDDSVKMISQRIKKFP